MLPSHDLVSFQYIQLLLGSQYVAHRLRICCQVSRYATSDITAGSTNLEGVLSCLRDPLAARLIEGGKVTLCHLNRQRLTLSWYQLTGLGESLQLMVWFLDLPLWCCHIDLGYLLACHLTCILDGYADSNLVTIDFHRWLAILESGITESEAKGIGNVPIERVKLAIAYIDILLVVGVGIS